MQAWEAIQNSLEYIEENLQEEMAMETLANVSSLSVFYYQRLFSLLVKKPVREYIKLRRLAKATILLGQKNERIIDIALACGFEYHETFTRVFKEAYAMTPEAYRRQPVILNQFDKPDLSLSYTMVDEGVPIISEGLVMQFTRMITDKPIRFVGIAAHIKIDGQIPLGEATGIDEPGQVWEKFHEIKDKINQVEHPREVGVAYLGNAPEGSFTYFVGAEVEDWQDSLAMSRFELPARSYIVCGFEAENFESLVTSALNKAVKYSGIWLKHHQLELREYSPEIYYENTPEAAYMELWMPVDF